MKPAVSRWTAAAASAVAALALVGSTAFEAPAAAATPVVIQFWQPTGETGPGHISADVIQSLVNTFNKTHPGIVVKDDPVSTSDNYVKYTTAMASGTGPNVIMTYSEYVVPLWAADGLTKPLNPYLAKYGFTLPQYFAEDEQNMRYNGDIVGLPQQEDEPALAINDNR
jgi:multiple sugar transport system substrate-binding protein